LPGAIARRSQRRLSRIAKGLQDPPLFTRALARIAKGDGCQLFEYYSCRGHEMDDPTDLVLAMMGVVIAAVMLVAGGLYLVLSPDPLPVQMSPPAVVAPTPTS